MTTPATPSPPAPVPPELLHSEDIRVGKCAQCSCGVHRQFARPKYIEGVLRSVCPICAEKAITHKCRGRVSHYYSAGDAIPMFCVDCGAEVVALPAEPQVSQIADAREGQVASRVIPDSLKIGAPQHEQAGESLPSATIEPTASDSSGDVHLARARMELASADREIERLRLQISMMDESTELATERTKALAQEGEIQRLKRELEVELIREECVQCHQAWSPSLVESGVCIFCICKGYKSERDAEREENRQLRELVNAVNEGAHPDIRGMNWYDRRDEVLSRHATPSPAPVAGKTNPNEISSPLVDGPVAVGEKSCPWHSRYMVGCLACNAAAGEKDSAGPTPRTDAEIDALETLDRVAAWAGLKRFARTLERELTASESLRREAFGLLELSKCPDCDGSGVYMTGGLYPEPQQCQFCFEKVALLTPPVAEGGEG